MTKRNSINLSAYKEEVDLEAKLAEWEAFYNDHRPYGSLKGQTPYEVLKHKLALCQAQFLG